MEVGVSLIWSLMELERPVRIIHQTTVGEVGVSLNCADGELGRPVIISHKNPSSKSGRKA